MSSNKKLLVPRQIKNRMRFKAPQRKNKPSNKLREKLLLKSHKLKVRKQESLTKSKEELSL